MAAEEQGEETDPIFAVEGDSETEYRSVERSNLLSMLKIAIKGLIETSMRMGRTLNDSHPKLQQFLILMELVFKHRLKYRRSILGQKRSFWSVIESFEKSSSEFYETVVNVRGIPGIKTMVGRGRAWLRFVLMQKKMADHFKTIADNKRILRDWYEPQAMMVSEDAIVVCGLLMGLNALDYNVMMSGEDFDKSIGVIDYSQYLRDGNYVLQTQGENGDEESELSQLLDQKAYLEELNRKLESNVDRLQSQLQASESSNGELKERVDSMVEELREANLEREGLRSLNERSSAELKKALDCLREDQQVEVQTYMQSRSGLNDIYSATQKTLDSEQKLRQQLEQEVETQKSIRQEKEMALQLLEKDIHEKQDSLVALRKQLEELKAANIKMQSQLKVANDTHQRDSLKVRSLESKLAQLTAQSKQTEKEYTDCQSRLNEMERAAKELGGKLEEIQVARSTAEADLAIEKQWRASLQMEIQREKDRVVELTNDNKKYRSLKKEHAELQEKYAALQETVSEQEIAMVEMGRQLSLSKQQAADMKQVSSLMKESVWQDDKDINDCQECKKPFSVSRRKHHCRSCGGIFCYACSDNAMQLASSSKPVRVCDSCHAMLLERAST